MLLPILRRRVVLDYPGERSSHTVPTPHGGGVAVVSAIAVVWIFSAFADDGVPAPLLTILAIAVGMAALSWFDDLKGLSVAVRLPVHFAAAITGLWALPGDGLLFAGALPAVLDHAVVVLSWVWFVNLYNFMDGMDGITGVETLAIAGGIALLAFMGAVPASVGMPAVAVAGAACGFLFFNWHPARIFLGDVGSVPLGFLLGWMLLSLAVGGLWIPAAILPLYYLADATITLARRALRGEKVWQAHKEHFYQRAHQAGLSHAGVVIRIGLANAVLVTFAVASVHHSALAALAGAGFVVAILLWKMATVKGSAEP